MTSGSHIWIGDVVKREEGGCAELGRQQRAEFACGNVSQQLMIAHWLRNNGESRGGPHSGHSGTGELCGSQSNKIKRLRSGDGGEEGL